MALLNFGGSQQSPRFSQIFIQKMPSHKILAQVQKFEPTVRCSHNKNCSHCSLFWNCANERTTNTYVLSSVDPGTPVFVAKIKTQKI